MIAFTTTVTDGIARVVFDLSGEKVNKFSAVVMTELGNVLDDLHARTDLKAVLFTSGKPGIFIAGAEIKEIQAIANRVDAQAKAEAGQRTFQRVRKKTQVTEPFIPEIGKPAPAFATIDDTESKVRLSEFTGKYVVLFFYPKDDTPG